MGTLELNYYKIIKMIKFNIRDTIVTFPKMFFKTYSKNFKSKITDYLNILLKNVIMTEKDQDGNIIIDEDLDIFHYIY